MKTLDAGHRFELTHIDGKKKTIIQFCKRIRGKAEGVNNQEVFRMLIERLKFLNSQEPCGETSEMIQLQRRCIRLSEIRALRRKLEKNDEVEFIEANTKTDGHVFKVNSSDTKGD